MVENAICRIFGKGSRRVIIPGLGAFIKKDNGEIIFTDMLRIDDGELVSSVVCTFGISEERAREIVAHYASGLKNELKTKGSVDIHGIGVLSLDDAGAYCLKQRVAEEDAVTQASGGAMAEAKATTDAAFDIAEPFGAANTERDGSFGAGAKRAALSTAANAVVNGRSEIEEAVAPSESLLNISEAGTPAEAMTAEPNAMPSENATSYVNSSQSEDSVADSNVANEAREHSGESATGASCEPSASYVKSSQSEENESDRKAAFGMQRHSADAESSNFPRTGRTDKSRLRSALYGEEEAENDAVNAGAGSVAAEEDIRVIESEPRSASVSDAGRGAARNSPDEAYVPRIAIRRPHKPKKRVDGVLITAIIALVITLGVLVYGYFTKLNIDRESGKDILIELNSADDVQSVSSEAGE